MNAQKAVFSMEKFNIVMAQKNYLLLFVGVLLLLAGVLFNLYKTKAKNAINTDK
jgi:hypothetical protein